MFLGHGVHSVNLGDDLFFTAILARYPSTQFYVYAPVVYKQILAPYPNCKVLCDSDKRLCFLARFCKLFHLPKSLDIIYYFKFNSSFFDCWWSLVYGGQKQPATVGSSA